MPGSPSPPTTTMALPLTPTRRALVAGAVGAVTGVAAGIAMAWQTIPLLGWAVAALIWSVWTWIAALRLSSSQAAAFATREEPHRRATELLLTVASITSLAAVALGIVKAGQVGGSERYVLLGSGIASIVASWGVVHTVFGLRYAALYYGDPEGGIDFNGDDRPTYADFAYLAFTIGMTYQVSDTDLTSRAIRHTALRHALLSFVLGTVVVAATVNIAAGLAG